ncbi:CHAT domain-containing protein [Mycolicibacterium neworleansense]|uniref:CHAT domain protein n=1 Tax=Mycolicibacterium neworleansense TaxID=146018 RepID=A0A0H5RZ37_9MYCO|nr:CHAT domain-containing protein [Mycolicibacterium neworleansense]MCV7363121.1 CHAT domain-containing protein [Mycolicibacterium neworleansense]CRZ13964.1 CHAT domain protein [Mycolicibacterium neworleansense]
MDDLAVTETLVMRFADVGIATYVSLRVVGAPERSVTWVIEEPHMQAVDVALNPSLPDPIGSETPAEAVERAVTTGAFATAETELELARLLGSHLIGIGGWQLLADCVAETRPVLFVTPSPRLGRVPWGQLAMPGPDGFRLMELVDVLMSVPPNIVHAPRSPVRWQDRLGRPPVLVLDPRIPGQRPDSPLGSVLGRPAPQAPLSAHFGDLVAAHAVLPKVADAVELFRRTDTDRHWLADVCAQDPSRLLYVGHASAADGTAGHADRAALHLAEGRPLTAGEMIATRLPVPPRVALLACASGGDYRFDEAAGLVAAMILGGAQLVTATLWSLPTTAGFRQFGTVPEADPMADTIVGVDLAHREDDAGLAVNRWQRAVMRRWRDGDRTASPLHWAALATFTVDGVR